MEFKLHSEYQPTGDQPQAIKELVEGFKQGMVTQLSWTTAKRLLSDFSTEVENIGYIQYPCSQGVL